MMRSSKFASLCFMASIGLSLSVAIQTSAVAQTAVQLPGETVITQKMLRSHGITRLHEILWLVDGARLSTVDDFSYAGSINGVGRSDQSLWSVFVDGLPETLGDWGVQNLDWLSIPLDEIDSVKVVTSPAVVQGLRSPWGRIEIWTRPVDEKVGASGMVMAINETGDPGPFRYSREELRLANIDKSGPDGSAALSWRGDQFSVRAVATVMQHIPSDAAAFSRNRAAFDTPTTPELLMRSLAVSVRHKLPDREHAVSARALDIDDMLFLNSVSREVPVVQRYASGSYRFRSRTSDGNWFSALTNVSTLSVENDERATKRPVRWDALRWTTSAQFPLGKTLSTGVALLFSRVDSDQLPTASKDNVLATIHVNARRSVAEFSAALSTDGKRVGFLTSARQTVAIRDSQSLGLIGAVARLVNEETGSAEYWTARGLRVDPGIPTEIEDLSREAWLVYAQADWRYSVNGSWLSLGVGPRIMVDGMIERRAIRWVGPAFEVDRRELIRAAGGVITVSGSAGTEWGTARAALRVDHRLRVGDRNYRSMDRSIPQTSVRVNVDYDASHSFWISAVGWYYSGSTWEDYEAAASVTERYSSSVGEFVRVDLSVTKGLWRNQIDFSVGLRNVFGSEVVLHPVGALLDRALSARLRVDV